MSLSELIPQNMTNKKFKHRRTQSGSDQEIHKFGMSIKAQMDQVSKPEQTFSSFPSSNETQAILNMIQQNHVPMMCIVEPLENNGLFTLNKDSQGSLSHNKQCGSLFNFGKNNHQLKQSLQNVELNSSNNPYALNLKDSNLFQIPELNDLGSNTNQMQDNQYHLHDWMNTSQKTPETLKEKNSKHQKVSSLNLLNFKDSAPIQQLQTLSAQLQKKIKSLTLTQTFQTNNKSTEKVKTESDAKYEPKSNQPDILLKHMFQNKKKQNLNTTPSQNKAHLHSNHDFLQKQIQAGLIKQKINCFSGSKNESVYKTPKSNARTVSNYTFSPEITNYNFIDDKAQYFQHRIHCSQLGDPKQHFGSFNLSKSEDGIYNSRAKFSTSKVEVDLIERIKQLESVIKMIRAKNIDIESLNRQLLFELKTSNQIQQDLIMKHSEIESRVYCLESILKSNLNNQRIQSTRMHTSELIPNNYITDNSIDQIEPQRQSKHRHFHTDN